MPQADAEGGDVFQKQEPELSDHTGVLRRVTGAIRKHHPVGLQGGDVVRCDVKGHPDHLAAPPDQFPPDVALSAEIPQHHPEAGSSLG